MPRFVKNILLQLALALVTLAAIEGALRVLDLRYLRIEAPSNIVASIFRHDTELGWSPTPNAVSTFTQVRTVSVRNNSLGLRDIEPDRSKPAILFIGDSFTWGFNVEAEERFTEILRQRLPGHTVVNAGVSGYGTDQEFLMMRRLWDTLQPRIVVLQMHVMSDRRDNTRNRQFDGYFKPYTVRGEGGRLEWRGQPVPNQRRACFTSNWFARNLMVMRLGCSLYVLARHPLVEVPDPTEDLIRLIRDFAAQRNARLFVGLQQREGQMEAFLRKESIPYVTFEDAEDYLPGDFHWTPKGHQLVADRFGKLLTESGAVTVAGR